MMTLGYPSKFSDHDSVKRDELSLIPAWTCLALGRDCVLEALCSGLHRDMMTSHVFKVLRRHLGRNISALSSRELST